MGVDDSSLIVKQHLPDINILHTIVRLENLDAYTPYEVTFTVVLFEGMVALAQIICSTRRPVESTRCLVVTEAHLLDVQ